MHSHGIEYSVFPIVDAHVYNSMKAVSENIVHASMRDVLSANHGFELDGVEIRGLVTIKEGVALNRAERSLTLKSEED
jgi:hypothetical protein